MIDLLEFWPLLNYRVLKAMRWKSAARKLESDLANGHTIRFCLFNVAAIDIDDPRNVLRKFSKTPSRYPRKRRDQRF